MSDDLRDDIYKWLVDIVGQGTWSQERLMHSNYSWSWEYIDTVTEVCFKSSSDATLFKLTWLN